MIPSDPLPGSAWRAIGAFIAPVCYTPQKRVKGSLVHAAFCWILLPMLGTGLTIPVLSAVLATTWGNRLGKITN